MFVKPLFLLDSAAIFVSATFTRGIRRLVRWEVYLPMVDDARFSLADVGAARVGAVEQCCTGVDRGTIMVNISTFLLLERGKIALLSVAKYLTRLALILGD